MKIQDRQNAVRRVFAVIFSLLSVSAAARPIVVGIGDVCSTSDVTIASVGLDYVRAIRAAGGVPLLIGQSANRAELGYALDRVDVLLMAGGPNIMPERYGEPFTERMGGTNPKRDTFEWALLDEATRRDMPVVGICRGCQLLNVYHGGSLHQDIPYDYPTSKVCHRGTDGIRRWPVLHEILAESDSLLAKWIGRGFSAPSSHHQSVKAVAAGFRVSAYSRDGVIEGIESENAIGVQFHPEKIIRPELQAFSRKFFTSVMAWYAERLEKRKMASHRYRIPGLIGGMGPAATCDLMQKVIELTDAADDQHNVHMIVDQNTEVPDRTAAILRGGEDPMPRLIESARRLEAAGADFLCMSCNTAHYFHRRLSKAVSIPVLNMPEESAKELKRRGVRTVGLLATDGTIQTGVYHRYLEEQGVGVVVPDAEDQKTVMSLIYDCVKKNVSTDRYPAEGVAQTVKHLKAKGAEAFLLACTELPIAFARLGYREGFVDPTRVLARCIVECAGAPLKSTEK